MNTCLICGVETKGSVGRAGFKWARLCQECKDREDEALERSMDWMVRAMDKVLGLGGAV
jgi:hypothetical protein